MLRALRRATPDPMEFHGPGSRRVPVTTCSGTTREQHRDLVAVEAPLEVRVGGERFAVMMRTPGADRPLALGFLFSEGVIDSRADVVSVDAWPGDPVLGNRVNVIVVERVSRVLREHVDDLRRIAMTSACGLCGLHAAALFSRDGEVATSAEDVGRHNAVDKIVGTMFDRDRLPLDDFVLAVSGRASFELVQKACLAGIPMLVAVSAPSSFAIDLAEACGITLVGFARGERFNIYAHPERIADAER